MAKNYHKTAKKKLTMRQSARVSAEKTVQGILSAFDQLADARKKVIKPILAEISVVEELLANQKNSGVMSAEEYDSLVAGVAEHKEAGALLEKRLLEHIVEIDKCMRVASEKCDEVIRLVKEGIPTDGTHAEYKETLLFMEIEHTQLLDEVVAIVSKSMFGMPEFTVGWSAFTKEMEKTIEKY